MTEICVPWKSQSNVWWNETCARIIEHFGRRGAIQEQLTMAIHNAVDSIISENGGVAVMISATHNCVKCRGVKHDGASMKTSKLSGGFKTQPETRDEFYQFVNNL